MIKWCSDTSLLLNGLRYLGCKVTWLSSRQKNMTYPLKPQATI
jgi:hypothetical protein